MAAYVSKYQVKPPVQSRVCELYGKILPGNHSSKDDIPEGKVVRELATTCLNLTSIAMRLSNRAYTGAFSTKYRAVIFLPVSMKGEE